MLPPSSGFLVRTRVKWHGRESDRSSPSSVEVKIGGGMSPPPIRFIAWCLINFTLGQFAFLQLHLIFEDGSSIPLRSVGIHLQGYKVSQPRRPQSGNYSLVQLISFSLQ
jgi:hypothetical protein